MVSVFRLFEHVYSLCISRNGKTTKKNQNKNAGKVRVLSSQYFYFQLRF